MGMSRRARIACGPVLVGLVSIAGFSGWAVSSVAAELTAPTPGQLQVLITTSELVVGHNRFAFGLLKDDKVLNAASVAVRLYDLRSQEARLTAETPAHYHKLEVVEQGKHIHIHPDGTRHAHGGVPTCTVSTSLRSPSSAPGRGDSRSWRDREMAPSEPRH